MKLTTDGGYTIVSDYFEARTEIDPIQGRSGTGPVGQYTTFQEAREASRGRGVQGEDGQVWFVRWRLYASGLVQQEVTALVDRRQEASGLWAVGPLNTPEAKSILAECGFEVP